jgi:hypothetical protein
MELVWWFLPRGEGESGLDEKVTIPSSSAKVKNAWSYTSTSQSLMPRWLIKHKIRVHTITVP